MSCTYGNHVLNNITVDLNVLREAIIERNYFMGQVSCFLRKMFRVINVIYFFITKMFQISNYFKKKYEKNWFKDYMLHHCDVFISRALQFNTILLPNKKSK